MLSSRQIFRYAVPARTVTKKALQERNVKPKKDEVIQLKRKLTEMHYRLQSHLYRQQTQKNAKLKRWVLSRFSEKSGMTFQTFSSEESGYFFLDILPGISVPGNHYLNVKIANAINLWLGLKGKDRVKVRVKVKVFIFFS